MKSVHRQIVNKQSLLNKISTELDHRNDTVRSERIVNTIFRAIKRRLSEGQWRTFMRGIPLASSFELSSIDSPSQTIPFKDYTDLMQAVADEDKQTERHDFTYAEEIDRAIQIVFEPGKTLSLFKTSLLGSVN